MHVVLFQDQGELQLALVATFSMCKTLGLWQALQLFEKKSGEMFPNTGIELRLLSVDDGSDVARCISLSGAGLLAAAV